MKLKVTVRRDENKVPRELEVRRGHKKVLVKFEHSPSGDVFTYDMKGRTEDLPTVADLIKIVDSRRLDRIANIELIDLISEITEIAVIRTIESLPTINVVALGSEGVALKQATAGAGGWNSPNASVVSDWADRPNSYDANTATFASFAKASIAWTDWLELSLAAAIRANKARVWLDYGNEFSLVQVQVRKDGVWESIKYGSMTRGEYVELSFGEGSVDRIKLRVYSVTEETIKTYEVGVWQVPSTGGELEIHDTTPP